MKILNFLFLSAITINTIQSQISPILDPTHPYASVEGAYYSDVNNDMNKFEGEWLWQNGNSSLLFKIEKVVEYASLHPVKNINYTVDFLVGEYKYIQNGAVLINTIPLFNTLEGRSHNIYGLNLLRKYNRPKCNECDQEEIRVLLRLIDPNRPGIQTTLVLRHGVQSGSQQEYITVRIYTSYAPPNEQYIEATVPSGTYTLFKQ